MMYMAYFAYTTCTYFILFLYIYIRSRQKAYVCLGTCLAARSEEETYAANFGPEHLYGDITEVEAHELPAHELLVGGFPCQPFTRGWDVTSAVAGDD